MARLAASLVAIVCLVAIAPVALAGPAQGMEGAGIARKGTADNQWVVKAQRALNRLGCAAGRPDGRLDRQVRAAAVRLQSRLARKQTGRLDLRTRKALHAEGAPRCDRRPIPKGSGKGRRIVVSQQQNWVWLVGPKGGVVAQGGMIDNPKVLKRGSHHTGSYCGRASRIRLNQEYTGRQWLDSFVRFAPCGIGFHRIPRWKSTGHQIHADWLLGTDQATSHGCLRLSKRLSERVWRFTTRRTTVRVV